LQLGDLVVLRAVGVQRALDYYHRKSEELRLYVDGVVFPMKPMGVDLLQRSDTAQRTDTAMVHFRLQRDNTTEPTWQLFYQVRNKLDHSAHLGLGFENGQLGEAFPATRDGMRLELVSHFWLNAGLVGTGALLLLLVFLGWRSNLVRSDVLRGETATLDEDRITLIGKSYATVPFSLSKVQLLFWTFLIVSAYLLCYLVTGELTTLPGDLLGLLGISLGSNLISRVLTQDQVKSNGPLTAREESAGFWRDIMAEQNRFSIARIQFVLFNLLVGLYFVRHVWKFWNLPDLADGLLPLISISSAGFLFGKSQEHPDPTKASSQTAAGTAGTAGADASITTTTRATPAPADPAGLRSSAPDMVAQPDGGACNVLPDGTPQHRADEDDNAAPGSAWPPAPPTSLALG
jgi:hypothetical protein